MAWGDHDKIWKEVEAVIDLIAPEYKKVSDAPSYETFERMAHFDQAKLDRLMQEEEKKRYKAIETATGNLFLVTNPALMRHQLHRSDKPRPVITRIKPKFFMLRNEALAKAKQSNTATNSTIW